MLAFATANSHAAGREPHIALMLPLASPSFGRAAQAVRQGFMTAAGATGKTTTPVRVYTVNEDSLNVLTVYEEAIESGALVVVGPLTRNGVTALAASTLVKVPTLALNTLDNRTTVPARLYLFGLGVEQESRQIAQIARSDGRRNALVLTDNSTLARRMRQAFAAEFARGGGMIVADLSFSADQQSLTKLRETVDLRVADMLFLALDAAGSRTARPYLGTSLPLYATSQVNVSTASAELNDIRFVDMPWLLQADHAAVMIYPRAQLESADLERLYALGIDAFRLSATLIRNSPDPALDGVTGNIRLEKQQFVRELTPAQFVAGKPVVKQPRR